MTPTLLRRPLTPDEARDLAGWAYPPPFDVYDSPAAELFLQRGADGSGYYPALDDEGRLVAFAVIGADRPVLTSTAVYALATAATRNPALLLASLVMGALFGVQRRVTGGIQAPVLTHVTWSALMLRFLPPLFADRADVLDPRPAAA